MIRALLFCVAFNGSAAVFAQVAYSGPVAIDDKVPKYCLDLNTSKKVECPDYLDNFQRFGSAALEKFQAEQFEELEAEYTTLVKNQTRLASGEWADEYYSRHLEYGLQTRNNVDLELQRFRKWQEKYPNSDVAKLFEAVYWIAQSNRYREFRAGSHFSFYRTDEKRKESLVNILVAKKVLGSVRLQAREWSLWHTLSIRVELALNPESKSVDKAILLASKKFPSYYPIAYAAMDRFVGPERRDAGRLEVYIQWVSTKLLPATDRTLYARVFAKLDSENEIPFDATKKNPSEDKLFASFEQWKTDFPLSYEVKNQFIYFVCRTTNGVKYWQLRESIGIYVNRRTFKLFDPKNCELKFRASSMDVRT